MEKNGVSNFDGIDSLRGFLALVVCAAHAWQIFVYPITGAGTLAGFSLVLAARLAVMCFFCVSGFVIAYSVQKNISRYGEFRLGEYSLSRGLRILPPLLFVIILFYFFAELAALTGINTLPEGSAGARPRYETQVGQQMLCLVTLCAFGELTGWLNGPLWSLQYEILLYVILGLLAVGLFNKNLAARSIAGGVLLVYVYFIYSKYTFYKSGEIVWFSSFAFGAAGFVVTRYLSTRLSLTMFFVSLLLSMGLFALHDPAKLLGDISAIPKLIIGQHAFAIACTMLVVLLAKVNACRRFAGIGSYSYTLYIVHFPLMLLAYFVIVNRVPPYSSFTGWVIAGFAVGVVVLISRALSKIIEDAPRQRAWTNRFLAAYR